MTRSQIAFSSLYICLLTGCASINASPDESFSQFAADDCKSLTMLFNDQTLNASANVSNLDGNLKAETSKDKFTWPWGKGGTNEEKLSKERAQMRKAHNQKGCAQ